MKHLDFDELTSFIFAEEINSDHIERANIINRHIFECQDCRKMYDAICSMHDCIEDLSLEMDQEETSFVRVIQAIYRTAASKSELTNLLDDFIQKLKNKTLNILLKIPTLSEICTSNFISGLSFYHPQYSGVMKSTGKNESREMKAVLIDDNYNRISIALDGTLSLRLQKDLCGEQKVYYLVPDNEEAEVIPATPKLGDDGLIRIDFYNLKPGDYNLII